VVRGWVASSWRCRLDATRRRWECPVAGAPSPHPLPPGRDELGASIPLPPRPRRARPLIWNDLCQQCESGGVEGWVGGSSSKAREPRWIGSCRPLVMLKYAGSSSELEYRKTLVRRAGAPSTNASPEPGKPVLLSPSGHVRLGTPRSHRGSLTSEVLQTCKGLNDGNLHPLDPRRRVCGSGGKMGRTRGGHLSTACADHQLSESSGCS
jgi:hypothetical protein